jgi:hypothetical protein
MPAQRLDDIDLTRGETAISAYEARQRPDTMANIKATESG